MSITVEKTKDSCKLSIDGEMNIYNAAELKKDILAKTSDCPNIKLDLSGVNEMDSSGLQLLLLLKREADAANKEFELVSQSETTRNVLELFNLKGFFGLL